MYHVQRRTGQIGQHDGAVRGLFLKLPRAGDAVVIRIGLAFGE
ncbi:Uncharacterised protein [Mycobacteroides abscessus subsp. abscessus]|nr:Uncharacterised protein [Mycobacteroides abscessus subsp. abscessus]